MDAALFQYTPEFRKSQLEGILTDCVLVYSKISSSKKELENNENKTINTHLTAQEYLAKMHEELPNGCYKFESKHLLEGTITLLHLWLDFTPCIVHGAG